MTGRETKIESTYRVTVPGVYLGDVKSGDTWHPFLMDSDELLKLYAAIKEKLGLD